MENLKELKELAKDLTVLYVEDDQDIANSMVSYLSKFFKEVVYAVNGEDGLAFFKQSYFDLVISDIKMPKIDGLQMVEEIKNMRNEQSVIIVSAHSEVDNFLKSIKLGVDGYIIKPVNYADMNNLLYKLSKKINFEKDITNYRNNLKDLLSQIQDKNHELEQNIDAIGKVAIVSKTNLEGKLSFVNEFFCDVSGFTKEELLGNSHNIIRHPDVSKEIFKTLWNTINTGKVWEGNLKNRNKNGEAYYVHETIIPLFENDEESIKEFMGISFLTTKEEMEKREFKKNIISSYQEIKKENFNANKRIKELEEQLISLKESTKATGSQDSRQRLQQSLAQIAFYEKEMAKMKSKEEKLIDIYNTNTRKLSELNTRYQMRIEKMKEEVEFYKSEHDVSKKEIGRLEDELKHQRKVIADLKDTIKNIVEEEDELKEQLNKTKGLGVLKDLIKKV